ncbi:MAG: bifunctional folylpolyglutamate synthase/dihydrofolate synthase [Ignavibacteria bacterium]|nr:bifunctional folylpolyglutamate synthase/dihydrofolate synthase [Ignavibacteria bacterium]
MKNIKEYFDYLYSLERSGMKYDLTNIRTILKHIGNPHLKFRSIHIAGTNGKGATASLIASILMETGLKTGLFTSPHILQFNERIRVNSKKISDKYIKEFIIDNIRLINKIKPSFFEVNTAIAFKYFADKKVDAAVIECGLGGRLDSTNILKPDVSVITQIGMDHMKYLGNSLKQIAYEKLGIVKPKTPVIVSDSNLSLKAAFKKTISKDLLYYLDDIVSYSNTSIGQLSEQIKLQFKNGLKIASKSPLSGHFQARNIAASIIAAKTFCEMNKLRLTKRFILSGIKNVKRNSGYMARLEVIKHSGRNYIFDISHNPDGIKTSINSIGKTIDVIVFGMMSDKDYGKSVNEVLKHSKQIIFTKPAYARALEPEELYRSGIKSGFKGQMLVTHSVKEAVKLEEHMKPHSVLFIGSFFLVSDAIKALKFQNYFKH